MGDRLDQFARANRRQPTEPELRLWRHLSASRLGGFKFRRQYRTEGRILDFFCPAIALGIEVDGHTHNPEEDSQTDRTLLGHGIAVIRFTNTDVIENMEGVLLTILAAARERPPRWARRPHPNPSPEGEGL